MDNKWNLDNLRLEFEQGADSAQFSYTAKVHDEATFEVGLDGQYRYTETPFGLFAAKGSWISDEAFSIDYQLIGYSAPVHYEITFDGSRIQLLESSLTGTFEYEGMTK